MKSFLEQKWIPSISTTGDEVSIVAEDGTPIARLMRPDRDNNLLLAGYITGLQIRRREPPDFDHSRLTTKFYQLEVGFCVCEHCRRLPE